MKILVAGDMRPYGKVAGLFEHKNFGAVLEDVKPFTQQADYSIVNLESPVVLKDANPIEKCGPNLKCAESCIEALKWAGFNCVTLANNHFLDYGEEGVRDTLETCGKYAIDTVGGGMNIGEASRIMYKEIDGKNLAIINCCEHEFSIASDNTAGSNPLNPIQQYYAIKEARKNADFVLVIVHGGHEHYNLPSPRMQETYRFFIDAGADAVVNHHQHCYSGYEIYNEKPIIYGLGNFSYFSSTPQSMGWYEGYMLMLNYSDGLISMEIIPYRQSFNGTKVVILGKESRREFDDNINHLNKIINAPNSLRDCHELWLKKNTANDRLLFQPYNSRIMKALFVRGLLPSFISRKKQLALKNKLYCESHLDSLRYSFEPQSR